MNFYLKNFIVLLISSLALFLLHLLLVTDVVFSPFKIYVFLFSTTYATVSGLRFAFKFNEQIVAYLFLVVMMVKFGLALIMFPDLLNSTKQLTILHLLEFLIPYFIFLFLETVMVVKWLNVK